MTELQRSHDGAYDRYNSKKEIHNLSYSFLIYIPYKDRDAAGPSLDWLSYHGWTPPLPLLLAELNSSRRPNDVWLSLASWAVASRCRENSCGGAKATLAVIFTVDPRRFPLPGTLQLLRRGQLSFGWRIASGPRRPAFRQAYSAAHLSICISIPSQ